MVKGRALLVVFLKFPEAGRVKTRLAAGIGAEAAVEAYCELVRWTLQAAGQWGGGANRGVWICFDPPEREADISRWLGESLRNWPMPPVWRSQARGDLGNRLTTVFHEAFFSGYQYVMAIGTDCPGLSPAELDAAANALRETEMVLGPTADGGYYLIGLSRWAPVVFEHIPWSSNRTFEATVAAAYAAGLSLHLLPVLVDIDSESDWRSWIEKSASRPDVECY